ncbi:hypothetical protein [Variovorax boronicumulans]
MKIRTVQLGAVDIVLMAVGLLCLGYGAYYVAQKELALAVTALGAGLVLLFASTIDRFESVKGLGMEAKTRKLDATIDKAEVAIDQLKELAEVTGATLITLMSTVGRHGGAPSVAEAHALSRKVLGILKGLKSSDEVVRAALTPWARAAAIDLFRELIQSVYALIQAEVSAMDTKMVSMSSAEQVQLAKQCQFDLGHPGRSMENILNWRLSEFEQKALNLLDSAPLIADAVRSQHREHFVRASREFQYLASNLDFRDRELWDEVRRKE